ncbi:helix-turn-helix domain-containing protein [Rhodococcus koreensis]
MRGFSPLALETARKAATLTRSDLARVAGVGIATVRRWETGESSPQVDALARVAKALKVSIGDVVRIDPDQRFPGDWRVLRGLTQPQLGALAGVSTAVVGSVERAEVALTDANAIRLARALQISVEDLRAAHERARLRPPGTPA